MSRIRRWSLSLLVVGAALGVSASPAGAWSSFCEDDPPVQVVTPAGHNLTVNNWVYYSAQDRRLMRQSTFYGTTYPAGPGHTLVVVHMITPYGGAGSIQVTSRTERFGTQAATSGSWGRETELYLIVDSD